MDPVVLLFLQYNDMTSTSALHATVPSEPPALVSTSALLGAPPL